MMFALIISLGTGVFGSISHNSPITAYENGVGG